MCHVSVWPNGHLEAHTIHTVVIANVAHHILKVDVRAKGLDLERIKLPVARLVVVIVPGGERSVPDLGASAVFAMGRLHLDKAGIAIIGITIPRIVLKLPPVGRVNFDMGASVPLAVSAAEALVSITPPSKRIALIVTIVSDIENIFAVSLGVVASKEGIAAAILHVLTKPDADKHVVVVHARVIGAEAATPTAGVELGGHRHREGFVRAHLGSSKSRGRAAAVVCGSA
mmetsp:Transcript_14884/g.37696  ORF Transcript_14884/g.37696 Transcript_14884/m.37696 type:complete len:229 (+) Transcript_14884:526-1212(+)